MHRLESTHQLQNSEIYVGNCNSMEGEKGSAGRHIKWFIRQQDIDRDTHASARVREMWNQQHLVQPMRTVGDYKIDRGPRLRARSTDPVYIKPSRTLWNNWHRPSLSPTLPRHDVFYLLLFEVLTQETTAKLAFYVDVVSQKFRREGLAKTVEYCKGGYTHRWRRPAREKGASLDSYYYYYYHHYYYYRMFSSGRKRGRGREEKRVVLPTSTIPGVSHVRPKNRHQRHSDHTVFLQNCKIHPKKLRRERYSA